MSWGDLVPHFPSTFDEWEGYITALALFSLKIIRPTLLKRRSSYVDRFGFSILAFDYCLGIFVLVTVIFTHYPGLDVTPWIDRILLLSLIVTAVWQTIEVIIAKPVRVEATMSGVDIQSPWEAGVSRDRRTTVPGRRATDITAYQMEDKYRAILRGDL